MSEPFEERLSGSRITQPRAQQPEHLKRSSVVRRRGTLNETGTRLSLETVFLPKLTAYAQDESLRDNEEKLPI